MEHLITKNFLAAFDRGGVVDKCISYIEYVHQIDYPKEMISPEWDTYYKERLPEKIREEASKFDDSVIKKNPSPLMMEIKENLMACMGDDDRKVYIFSILKPFRRLGITGGYIGELNKIMATKYKIPLPGGKAFAVYDTESLEGILLWFLSIKKIFADNLDALLLQYGINLFDMQNECGIHLKNTRDIMDIEPYIGSHELTVNLISKVEKQKPVTLNPKLKGIFENGINSGLIDFDGKCYKWTETKTLLAYLADKASREFHLGKMDENKEWRINWKLFEQTFNTANLKSAKHTWLTDNYEDEFLPPGHEKVDALFK